MNINHFLNIKPRLIGEEFVVDGDWDTNVVIADDFFNMSLELFVASDPCSTRFYEHFKRKNGDKTDQYVEKYLALYKSIETHGYLDQTVGLPAIHADNTRRVCVLIGRHGNHIVSTGRHRVAIARHLSVRKIPVDVIMVHRLWRDVKFL